MKLSTFLYKKYICIHSSLAMIVEILTFFKKSDRLLFLDICVIIKIKFGEKLIRKNISKKNI